MRNKIRNSKDLEHSNLDIRYCLEFSASGLKTRYFFDHALNISDPVGAVKPFCARFWGTGS